MCVGSGVHYVSNRIYFDELVYIENQDTLIYLVGDASGD